MSGPQAIHGPRSIRYQSSLRKAGQELCPRARTRSVSARVSIYWGYRVTRSNSKLTNVLERERFDLTVGKSRYGTEVQDVWTEISDSLRSVSSILVVFGSPKMRLTEILGDEGKRPSDIFNFFVNTVPGQSVATVRTEEAVFISLGILNIMRYG